MSSPVGKPMINIPRRNITPHSAQPIKTRLPGQSAKHSGHQLGHQLHQQQSNSLISELHAKPSNDSVTSSLFPLLRLYEFLQLIGLRVNYRESSASQPFEQVIVGLDPTEQEPARPEYLLQIAFAEDLQAGLQGRAPDYTHGATLLFSVILPVQINVEQRLDAYRLLAVLNRILPIGHLGLHEGLQPALVFFKYPLAALKPNLSMNHVLSVIEQISTFVLLLSPALQEFSRSHQSVDAAREAVESLLLEQSRELYQVLKTNQAGDE